MGSEGQPACTPLQNDHGLITVAGRWLARSPTNPSEQTIQDI